jgi:DNA-binding transcriptional LysR family regulator
MAIDAAASSMGIALESTFMMWRELQEGRLICPIANPPEVVLITQWIVCPHDHLRHSKVRAFNAWIKAERDIWQKQTGSVALSP